MYKKSVFKVIIKWLLITLVVIAGLTVILLGLGYLLHENEQETRELKQRIDNGQASVVRMPLTSTI